MVIRFVFFLVSLLVWPLDFLRSLGKRITLAWYEHRIPPWLDIGPCDPLGETAGEHSITFASRHDIAECGLKCQKCQKFVADRGDFKPVRRTRLGEAVVCPGCGDVLVAAPDTEHGDDLRPYHAIAFHSFVRISELEALREKYGPDMAGTDRSPVANPHRYEDPSPRVSVRQLVAANPEEQALAEGIPWSEVEPPPTEPSFQE